MKLEIGDIIEGKVSDFASEGEGVIKMDGYPVFVPCAIKGEQVRAAITFVKKDCAFARLIEVLVPSPDRIKPLCTYFGKCGGCDLQHISTPVQLEIKRESVRRALKKNAGIDIEVPTVIRLNDWEYRNKLSLPFAYNKRSKRVSLGFFEKKSHSVVPIKWCPLHGEWASKLIECVTEWANMYGISVYDEATGKGMLRHVVARKLDTLCVTIVVNSERFVRAKELVCALNEKFDDFTLYYSPNLTRGNVIMGAEARHIYGREKKQNLGILNASLSPQSFLQVNNKVRDAIYDEVANALCDFDGDIIELYSGVGLLTAQLALRLKDSKFTAVEIVKSASEDAAAFCRELGIENRVKCICDDASHFVSTSLEKPKRDEQNADFANSPYYIGDVLNDKRRALVLDPPRRGCDRSVVDALNGFERIVYVSCNPQTLARDVKLLSDRYKLAYVKAYDMFPQTANVEVVAVLVAK